MTPLLLKSFISALKANFKNTPSDVIFTSIKILNKLLAIRGGLKLKNVRYV